MFNTTVPGSVISKSSPNPFGPKFFFILILVHGYKKGSTLSLNEHDRLIPACLVPLFLIFKLMYMDYCTCMTEELKKLKTIVKSGFDHVHEKE
jgi:hypothetical protein